MSVLSHRAKLLGYDQDESNQKIGDHNTLIWLNKGSSVIESLVASQPEEVNPSDQVVVDVEFEEE